MKRMLESMLRGPGWFWNHKIRIAVLIILAVTTPHQARRQFLDRCCESITVAFPRLQTHSLVRSDGHLANVRARSPVHLRK